MIARPAPGPIARAGAFGWRQLPGEQPTYHGGLDFIGSIGTPVRAVKNGVVYIAAPNGTYNRYGNMVVIKHDDPREAPLSLYAHMSSIAVRRGQKVVAGQRIGAMGNTSADRCVPGKPCDPNHKVATHLHFELLKAFPALPDTGRIDPTAYLSPGMSSPTGPVYKAPAPTYAAASPVLYPAYQGPVQYPAYPGVPFAGVQWTGNTPRPFSTAPGAGGLSALPVPEPEMDPTTQLVVMLGLLPFGVALMRSLGVLEAKL